MRLKIERSKPENGVLQLKLTGELTVYSARRLKDFLLNELKSCSQLSLNLAGVNEADTAGFQLLLFMKRETQAAGKRFIVSGAGGRLESIISLYRETI